MKDNNERLNKKQKFYLKAAISMLLCAALVILCNISGGFIKTIAIIGIALLLIHMRGGRRWQDMELEVIYRCQRNNVLNVSTGNLQLKQMHLDFINSGIV